ncbi:MAG: peptide chain release factor N(5)-glutamine methyltransferase [Alphaproteobacteria bacterium]|nr:peptide chain release factor N(5)-glutamine methyltransferase [Alphaproteobacteria bacterium]
MSLPNRLTPLYHHLRHSFWSAGIETADLDARIIIRYHTQLDWGDLITNPDAKISPSKLARIEFDVERRLSGEPVSRIYNTREFWGLDFQLCPDTLDPRPDTETLVEIALDRLAGKPPERILDMGVGTGCILISLLNDWERAEGYGMDKSFGAIRMATSNAQRLGVADRCHLWVGSWGEALGLTFPLIVSNPPYIPVAAIESLSREVRNHDPILALAGGPDGLDAFRSILTEMKRLLDREGLAFLEIGYDQRDDVLRLVEESGFRVKDVHPDLAGVPRVVEISHGDN